MRSVGLLPPHSTPDLLDRLGARHVNAHAAQPHAIGEQPRHRTHEQIAADDDRDVRDARAEAEHALLERGARFRTGTRRLGQVDDVGEPIPVSARSSRADRT